MMLKFLAMAATLTAPATPPAPPPSPAPHCITRQQIGDISVVSIAISVETMRNACRSHLPATAYLVTPAATEFSSRLRAEARQRLDSGIAGFTGMMGTVLDPETARTVRASTEAMLREGGGTEMSQFITPEICADANEIIEIGSNLSPDQMARFFGAFGSLADHFIRMIPAGAFGPGPHPPIGPPVPAPPAAAPTPAPTPAAFELQRRAGRPTPPPAPQPDSPPRPFLCRDSG